MISTQFGEDERVTELRYQKAQSDVHPFICESECRSSKPRHFLLPVRPSNSELVQFEMFCNQLIDELYQFSDSGRLTFIKFALLQVDNNLVDFEPTIDPSKSSIQILWLLPENTPSRKPSAATRESPSRSGLGSSLPSWLEKISNEQCPNSVNSADQIPLTFDHFTSTFCQQSNPPQQSIPNHRLFSLAKTFLNMYRPHAPFSLTSLRFQSRHRADFSDSNPDSPQNRFFYF
jgi:hypothetical protein